MFEGPDAAGKGGAIRRLTAAMDARDYQVMSVAAPTDEERAHPYLWRFWRHLPPPGRVMIYDRSWYGRVLVERVEGFAKRAVAAGLFGDQRIRGAVDRIRAHRGEVLAGVSAEEQLSRFKPRQTTPYKQYKLTGEDWRTGAAGTPTRRRRAR